MKLYRPGISPRLPGPVNPGPGSRGLILTWNSHPDSKLTQGRRVEEVVVVEVVEVEMVLDTSVPTSSVAFHRCVEHSTGPVRNRTSLSQS